MNRRNFLHAGLSALIGAAVIPKIPLAFRPQAIQTAAPATLADVPYWISSCSGGAGKITYEMLNAAYLALRNDPSPKPDLMIVSKYHARLLSEYYE